MNTNYRNPTKKRKVDDGRADVSNHDGRFVSSWLGYFFSGRRNDTTLPAQLDRMEQMMMRMEDMLGTISSLESRCVELERKCSSLENKLESTLQAVKDQADQTIELESSITQSLKDHVDQKFNCMLNNLDEKSSLADDKIEALRQKTQAYHDYNTMLLKNQSWKYSADIPPIDQIMSDTDCDYQTAVRLTEEIRIIKESTTRMRRGEFTRDSDNVKDISLHTYPHGQNFYSVLRPHLEEFAAALKEFTPAMKLLPNECDKIYFFSDVMLDNSGQMMMKEALMGKPFTSMEFFFNRELEGDYEGMTVNNIAAIAESNKHLRRLEFFEHYIHDDVTNRLCSVVHNNPLLELYFQRSIFGPRVGNAILTNLFTNVELKLEKLSMPFAGITSDVSTVLADFIAANPALKLLDLEINSLEDSDAALIASALRSNTILSFLGLSGNNITKSGFELFQPVLCNESSLNAVAESNHSCYIFDFHNDVNCTNAIEMNRGRKIFTLLSSRHEEMSNVQYFSDVDVNLLPNMLEAVERYRKTMEEEGEEEYDSEFEAPNHEARSLSIVYEIMRRWDKVFNLYEV